MEKTINAVKEKAALLNAYANLLEDLEHKEHWYQHRKTVILPDSGEEVETEDWEDDSGDYAATNLSAIRNVVAAIRKLAGV